MNQKDAQAIACWHYEGIFSFYDIDRDVDDLKELLDPHRRGDKYYAVVDQRRDLAGFFSFHKDYATVIIGLGLRPDLTGIGLGQDFVEAGLEFAKRMYNPDDFLLNVATFNKRAIKVYEKLGFKPDGVYLNETNGGRYEFLRMVRDA